MWAYGSPEIWPDGFHTDVTDPAGNTLYEPNRRSFSQRLFNRNSLPFFILFIIMIVCLIFESIIIRYFKKVFFKSYDMVDTKQATYTACYAKMSDLNLSSYDPSKNIKYAKILNAILDVAEENIALNQSAVHRDLEKSDIRPQLSEDNSENELNQLDRVQKLPAIDSHRQSLAENEQEHDNEKPQADANTVNNANINKDADIDEEEES